MACVEIPGCHKILTPSRFTLGLKDFANIANPDLFSDGFWNRFLMFSLLTRLRDLCKRGWIGGVAVGALGLARRLNTMGHVGDPTHTLYTVGDSKPLA